MDIITQSNEAKMFEHLQRIEATLITKLNLADFQNAIPMFCELTVFNEAPESVDNLELRVESIPAFLKPKIWRLNSVGSGKSYQIPNPDVQLDGSLLTRLTEAENAFVSIVLCYQGEPLNELARIERTVELLPRNQWGGLSHLPDMIAAFVQPNEPAVERLLKKAADVLRKNDKNPALDGYAGGSKRSWELVSSIWSVVAGMGLDYALPPASFEYSGQKIRGAAQITESGLATCLDLALLFCSAIEQVGLNPLLVFTKGHAFAGVWLKPKEFSTTVIDDVTALRKRIKLQELVLFETTVITQRPAPSFSYAIQLGAQQISEEKEETFELAIDIRRARLHRIKPLASAELPIFTTEIIDSLQAIELPIENSPDLPDDEVFDVVDNANLSPKDRVAHWQRKLLDLSLRNNLLNFKKGKKALKLEAPNPGALEDLLSDGQVVKLLPRPVLMNGLDPRNQAIYEDREHENLRRGHALDALERREVFVDIPQAELDAQLVDLYRKSRTSQQEGGANTLFLAIGFLSWTQDDKAGQSYRAPLILLPVTLNRRSVRSGFTLTLHDDEPRFNPTLIEMLRQDFKLNLGVTDGELPKDEAGLDVASIWKTVSVAIKDIRGWEVVEDIILATFSFSKYLMWKDLVERTDQLRENPVVRHLIDSPRESYPSSIAFPDPKKLDNDFKPEQTFCPLPVDSSQLSAVMAAVKGKDFVLIGPPGTGKSQTISNIIAQCLAEKKRVLFVSEKIAALDVVYRRLRAVGLGDFCLELHSSKARKLDVLAQLQKSWEARGEIDSEVWRAEAQRLKKMRDQLNIYVERLHFPHPNGLTLFKAIGRVTFGHNVPELRLFWDSANAHDSTSMEALRDVVGRLEVNAKAVGQSSLLNNPFAAIGHSEWSPKWQQTFIDATHRTLLKAKAVEKTYEQFVQTAGLPQTSLIPKVLKATAILAKLLPHAFGRDLQFLLRDDAIEIAERLNEGAKLVTKHQELSSGLSSQWSDVTLNACQRGIELLTRRQEVVALLGASWVPKDIERLKNGLRLFREIDELKQEISVQYSEGIELIEVHQVQREWAKAEKSIWPVSWFRKKKICKKTERISHR
ncbi:MAG: DUF4011 domain-containing protein [Chlorobium sp.]|nr:DUF4011 domain-containing protein [Chlorobium sp.]